MDGANIFDSLKNDTETPLYVDCSKFTKLSALLKLYNFKVENE